MNEDYGASGPARAPWIAPESREIRARESGPSDAAGAPLPRAGDTLRIVEDHSGLSEVLGPASSVQALLDVVARCLEGGRRGARFPLLPLLSRRGVVTAAECDALAREVVRLRAALAACGADALREAPRGSDCDPALSAAVPLDPVPEPFPRWNGNGPPKTLADAFARPLFAVERLARLGSASRRGARIEAGDPATFGAAERRLSP